MTPRVSIILPIYNVEKYLKQCLNSVAAQTLNNIEVICVDDGSTDSSPSIIDAFVETDKRFKAIHKENGGYGKAVNAGLDIATGQYIGIVEPDDYIDITMYEKLVNNADANGCPDIVKACYWRVCDADTEQQQIHPGFYLHTVAHPDRVFTLDEDAEFLYHHPSIWTAIYRRDFLLDKGIRMKEIPGAGWADNPWLIETLAQASSISYVEECLYYYREFNTGSSSNVKDPSIIYNRWFDMDDIVKRLGITSPTILEGHYNRGCAYIGMLADDFDDHDPQIRSAIDKIIDRMDMSAIVLSKKIPPYFKDAYLKQTSTASLFLHPYLTLYRCARRIKRAIKQH